MTIWEVINYSDEVTFLAEDYNLAVVATLLMGMGNYGLKEHNGEEREMPMFCFMPKSAVDEWLVKTFPELKGQIDPLEAMMSETDRLKLAEILRSAQICSIKDREAYQMALTAIDDLEKRRNYSHWWKEQRATSLNDIVQRCWQIADRLETLHRKEQVEVNLNDE